MRLTSLWVYLTAPVVGALVGVAACRCVHDPECCGGRVVRKGALNKWTNGGEPKRVLFVCVENSNRSQMAEAFARMHGGAGVQAFSAGSRPSGKVNPKAVEAMRELGYDLTAHRSKGLVELAGQGIRSSPVGMGCGDEGCPLVKAGRHEEWDVPDPKALEPAAFREVRDLIGRKVRELLDGL